jgi:aspartate dehydrogenase
MSRQTTRIGLIGYGQIGMAVHGMIDADATSGMEVVFVHDADASRYGTLREELVLENLENFESRQADLVVEMAHPDVTRKWGPLLLEKVDYMLISVTALADQELENSLREITQRRGTRAYIPHGGVVGMDALFENRDVWEEVHVTMKKPPQNVDCANAGIDSDSITGEKVLYDGPTRGICPLFPRNVNTHASIAFAGIGFDRTHSILVVSPEWNTASVAIVAKGPGLEMKIERVEEIMGVTGASTPASIYNSVQTIGATGPGIHLR